MSVLKFFIISFALLGTGFLLSCGSHTSVQTNPALAPPTVVAVVPQSNGVATNREIAVVFSKDMDPNSINTSTFLVPGVVGTVTYDATNRIAAFKSSTNYAANTAYFASITVGAKDTSGAPLAAPFNFSFVTRATADNSAPYVAAVNLAVGATCVPLSQKIDVTFDEQMNSLTINPSTFHINGVTGAVTYDVLTQTATFTPSTSLAANTTYTITVTTGAQDMGGMPLTPQFVRTFTTGPCEGAGTLPVALCPDIGNFSVLAGSTVTNTGTTTITGDVGVSQGSSITGFPPGQLVGGGTFHRADGAAAQAQTALASAYVDAAGRSGGTAEAGDLVGKTLTAGVYTSSSSLALSGDVTLDAQGNPNAVFIIQIASTLTTASGSHVILANGAKACNVFWQVGSSATLGTNSVFKGNILALASITITTGVNLEGRALARTGAVTLDTDVISGCTCP